MKKIYQLIKLRAETVEDLKRLKDQMGKPGLDDLIQSMIRMIDIKRLNLKDAGWQNNLSGRSNEKQFNHSDAV
jgi:hypothetical protein